MVDKLFVICFIVFWVLILLLKVIKILEEILLIMKNLFFFLIKDKWIFFIGIKFIGNFFFLYIINLI